MAEDRAWMETYCTVLVYILKSMLHTCNKIKKKMKTEANSADTRLYPRLV